ncbi:hypothetical protein Taro_011283 [Colocasia esculenta]|uniref:Uncharacterized protein n=1 Tax=Colocasia esculenta TaxID=4460 RepID=A0A843UFM3_COLES|nr:hypothetical protein [Colocasia esculenta]
MASKSLRVLKKSLRKRRVPKLAQVCEREKGELGAWVPRTLLQPLPAQVHSPKALLALTLAQLALETLQPAQLAQMAFAHLLLPLLMLLLLLALLALPLELMALKALTPEPGLQEVEEKEFELQPP